MRVLWLIDSLTLGGAEALVPAFARAVDGRAHLHVAFLKRLGGNPFEPELDRLGVPLTHLGARHLRDARALARLVRLVRDGRFDVVHAHLTYAGIWGGLAARVTGAPCVATLHTGPVEGGRWSADGLRERLLAWVLNRWCESVVVVSEAARAQHLRRGLLRPGKTRVIHNGVDGHAVRPARGPARSGLALSNRQPVLLTVCALRAGKGLEVLLGAAARLAREWPSLRLLVAGEGPRREPLERQARALGLEPHVRWLGLRRDVPALCAAADLFVLASHEDAFPTVLLEAMAASCAVVATRVGGIPEIVGDGETGLLVPAGDPAALAGAIDALLRDPARRAALAAAGRERVRARFSAEHWADRLLHLYRDAAGARAPAGAAAEAT